MIGLPITQVSSLIFIIFVVVLSSFLPAFSLIWCIVYSAVYGTAEYKY